MMLLALPQPGPPIRDPRLAAAGGGLELEHRAEAQPEQARAADPQDVAAGDPEVPIAEVLARLVRERSIIAQLPFSHQVTVRFVSDASAHNIRETPTSIND